MQIVTGRSDHLPSGVFMGLARYRHRVFVEKLGWQLKCQDGLEFDQFDRPDTLYVVAQDQDDQVVGGARLLPTTRPYLLGEIFPQLLNGQHVPNSPDIWELSRFAAVDFSEAASSAANPAKLPLGQFSSPVAVELLQATLERAAESGARRVITVSPLGVERLLRKAGFSADRAGSPVLVDGNPIIACWINVPGYSPS
ncbi:acyl-homoserine-lactone synthase [Chitinimonas prasina]|uniref:acyl-homoserine-lactone synthase n=1 Tax=Chitinimonas prasina TaxID=1434937 RepID=UPI0024E05E5A|nr:acyl-homoserine-lactone synthase [Chitinimonas prasina]